jgi:hypothetical protein
MAKDSVTFEVHANVNHVETGGPDGKLLRIEEGKPYETSDPTLIALLDDLPGLKRASKSDAKDDK